MTTTPSPRPTATTERRASVSVGARVLLTSLSIAGLVACADKAPPARFRDPPPPTLATPLPPEPPATDPAQDDGSPDQSVGDDSSPSEIGALTETGTPTAPTDPGVSETSG